MTRELELYKLLKFISKFDDGFLMENMGNDDDICISKLDKGKWITSINHVKLIDVYPTTMIPFLYFCFTSKTLSDGYTHHSNFRYPEEL